jgi:hypothetical protein
MYDLAKVNMYEEKRERAKSTMNLPVFENFSHSGIPLSGVVDQSHEMLLGTATASSAMYIIGTRPRRMRILDVPSLSGVVGYLLSSFLLEHETQQLRNKAQGTRYAGW